MFSYKIVIFKGIWIFFCSRFTHSCLWPFSFYSFLLPPDFRPPTRSESACLYIVGGASLDFILRRKGQSHDVAHEAWQRPYSERSWTYSLRSWSYPFATSQDLLDPWSPSPYRLQSRGGVKGLVGFLESCAAIADKTESLSISKSTHDYARPVHHRLTF